MQASTRRAQGAEGRGRHGFDNDGVLPGQVFAIPKVGLARPPARRTSYIAAACLEARGLADESDCYEVRLLRLFGDEHVARLPEGGAILAAHREKDLLVARALERLAPEELREAYLEIYEGAVAPVVSLIMVGLWDEAHALYELARGEVEDRLLGRVPGDRNHKGSAGKPENGGKQ